MENIVQTIAIHTLGCKLNFSESATLSGQLEHKGYKVIPFESKADIYVINTCSVTENADKECKYIINKIKKLNNEAKIIVTGCYAQLKPEEIATFNGVNLVLGAAEKFNLVEHLAELNNNSKSTICWGNIEELDQFQPSFSISDRTRSFLKIQDGCDYTCSFCTIPQARGKSRSNLVSNVLNQLKKLEDLGLNEVVLTGINLGDYKIEQNSKMYYFIDLLKEIEEKINIPRLRLSSIEPNLITEELIDLVASSKKFMPHFHIPLQSGCDKILKKMQRRYLTYHYLEKINWINNKINNCGIGIDVIVGFPDETDKDFLETLQFLEELSFSYLHVFTYSERLNTPAVSLPHPVNFSIRKDRNFILQQLGLKKQGQFKQSCRGQNRPVLFEKINSKNKLAGYSDNYIRVNTEPNLEFENKIISWTI